MAIEAPRPGWIPLHDALFLIGSSNRNAPLRTLEDLAVRVRHALRGEPYPVEITTERVVVIIGQVELCIHPPLGLALTVALDGKDPTRYGDANSGFQGWSKAKASLDKRPAEAGLPVRSWRLHDLRRSVATGMAERLGVLPHVIEAVLNHVSGHRAGVAGIDNRAPYGAEKRVALEMWANHIASLLSEDGRG
jgi:integrase